MSRTPESNGIRPHCGAVPMESVTHKFRDRKPPRPATPAGMLAAMKRGKRRKPA